MPELSSDIGAMSPEESKSNAIESKRDVHTPNGNDHSDNVPSVGKDRPQSTTVASTKAGEKSPPKKPKVAPLERSNTNIFAIAFGFGGKGRRISLVAGILMGLGIPYLIHSRGLHPMDVLDEYVERSHEALRSSQEVLLSHASGDKIMSQLRELMDFTPRLSPRVAELRPGQRLALEGVRAKHPVVLVPGIVTTGLELWDGEPCAKSFFRQRMWGTMTMVQNVMLNTRCWLRHMALNVSSGGDPANIKLRASQGFEAADYVLGGYWVWGKLIENLADIGYDSSTMHMAAYDWRLSFKMVELRDQYYTRLTGVIEALVRGNGGKGVVVVSHSMGGNIFLYYMQWVSAYLGPGWIDTHIHSFVSIATPFLGVPKGLSALLSGEAKDTAEMGLLGHVLDQGWQYISPWDRRTLFRSWGSAHTMLPRGGNRFWGGWVNETGHVQPAVDAKGEKAAMLSNFIFWDDSAEVAAAAIAGPPAQSRTAAPAPSTVSSTAEGTAAGHRGTSVEESIKYLLESSAEGPDADAMLADYMSLNSHHLREEPFPKPDQRKRCIPLGKDCDSDPKHKPSPAPEHRKEWTNPLTMQLPPAKHMTIYCLYGVGKETERAYFYRPTGLQTNATCQRPIRRDFPYAADVVPPVEQGGKGMQTAWLMDKGKEGTFVSAGMIKVDGDGSVPLLSLGYMCSEGWSKAHFNPGGVKVRTREFQHAPVSFIVDPRGGPNTADHVDIMGNHDLIADVLKAASGLELEERYFSDIREMARRVPLPRSIR